MTVRELFRLFKETFFEWAVKDVKRLSAALAYYAAFSLIALTLALIILTHFAFRREGIHARIVGGVERLAGAEIAQNLEASIEQVGNQIDQQPTLTIAISVVTLVYSASRLFRNLKDAINVIWDVHPERTEHVRTFVKDSLVSIGVVIVVGIALLLVLLLNAAMFGVVQSLDDWMAEVRFITLWQIAGYVVLIGLMTVFFAVIFRYLPNARVAWHDVWVGAGITACLFAAAQFLIGQFMSVASIDNLFGVAGMFIVLLIWVYICARLFLFGAKFTQMYARRFGSTIQAELVSPAM
jgi:membrane protein